MKPLQSKDLNNIRPAKGAVKTKKVIENVPRPEVEPPMPTDEALKIADEVNRAKTRLIEAMKSFNFLLNNEVLNENKGEKEKAEESIVINELISSTKELEHYSGEGVLNIGVFSLRLLLRIKDVINHLSYDHQQLNKRLLVVEQTLGLIEDPKEKEKRELIERAKELGLNVVEK